MESTKPILTVLGEINETSPFLGFTMISNNNPPVIIENKQRISDSIGRTWERHWDFNGLNHGDWIFNKELLEQTVR